MRHLKDYICEKGLIVDFLLSYLSNEHDVLKPMYTWIGMRRLNVSICEKGLIVDFLLFSYLSNTHGV